VKVLARLPGREELLARTVSTLNMPLVRLVNALALPMRSLVYALRAIEDKRCSLSL
jgi:ribosomal protein L10